MADRRRILALAVDGARRELELESFWPHKGQIVLKFAGIDSIDEAQSLAGCELQIPSSERARLEPGWAYVSDLVGSTVWDGEREVGRVKDVQFGAGEAPLLVVERGSKLYEIPYAEAYLKTVDASRQEIHMLLPEGMLEVNAPLTEEEKKRST